MATVQSPKRSRLRSSAPAVTAYLIEVVDGGQVRQVNAMLDKERAERWVERFNQDMCRTPGATAPARIRTMTTEQPSSKTLDIFAVVDSADGRILGVWLDQEDAEANLMGVRRYYGDSFGKVCPMTAVVTLDAEKGGAQ